MTAKNNLAAAGYLVAFVSDDGWGYVPMGFNPSIEGGLVGNSEQPAMFDTRAAAQRAIRISVAAEKLDRAQGKPINEDWIEGRKQIRIVTLVAASTDAGGAK